VADIDSIREDLMVLAGRLAHRGAHTDLERQAAEYVHGRLRESVADVETEGFAAIDNVPYLYATYYAEFLLVALMAVWFPAPAAIYGAAVFICYLAEFLGYPAFSRLLPHYETQNVVARLLAPKPRKLFIITAHYDSGCASPLSTPAALRLLRPLHAAVVAAMVLVIATCAIDAHAAWLGQPNMLAGGLRWLAALGLGAAGLFLFYASSQGEDIRGANHNASGVAALILLARRLAAEPLAHADVWLVALGAHESGAAGMRHLITAHRPDAEDTRLLNLEGIGAGRLHYLSAEGMLLRTAAGAPLVAAAREVAGADPIHPAVLRAVPSGAGIPLQRGYAAMTLMGLDRQGLPVHWNSIEDRVTNVDERAILRAADFAEALLRHLDAREGDPPAQ
jgi:hypothetical protein